MASGETRGYREQMHGGDYEKYVCMDVSADEVRTNKTSLEQVVRSTGREAMDSRGCIRKLCQPKKKQKRKEINTRADVQLVTKKKKRFAQ